MLTSISPTQYFRYTLYPLEQADMEWDRARQGGKMEDMTEFRDEPI